MFYYPWGSTHGALSEAHSLLLEGDINAGVLSFSDVWPLPEKELKRLAGREVKIIVVENNSTGQFARLLTGETGIRVDSKIL